MVKDGAFRHLDPSSTRIYRQTVMYGIEAEDHCFYVKVKNGWLIETPALKPWARGQHIDTLKPLFKKIMPLWIVTN